MGWFIGTIITIFLIGVAVYCCVVSSRADDEIEYHYYKKVKDLEKEKELLELMLYEMTMELEDEDNTKELHSTDNK